MAPENFSIGAFYNITKNQDNQIITTTDIYNKPRLTRITNLQKH